MALPKKVSYLVGGTFDSVAPILIDGDLSPLQVDSSGNLLVNVATFSGSITATNPSVGLTGATAPTSATEIGVVDSSGKLQHVTGLDLTNAFALTVAIVDGSGNQITSFGGGSQFAMGSAQSSSALGTIALGYDGTNVRGLLTSNTGQLHVIIDSATLGNVNVTQGTSPWVVSLASTTITGNVNVVGTTTDGTTAETNFLVIGGESNDATAQYQPLPLGSGGRSVIVEGVNAVLTAATGNPVLVGGVDNAGNLQYLPVAQIAVAAGGRVAIVGGLDLASGVARPFLFSGGSLVTAVTTSSPFLLGTSNFVSLVSASATSGALLVGPYVYSVANTAWSRLSDAGVVGTVGVGGAAASGTTKGGNPVQIGGVFNAPQPTVVTGQIVEAQSTARGSLIVATGVDSFVVTDSVAESSLSTIAAQTSFNAQILDALYAVLHQLGLLNKNIASTIPGADSTPEGIDIGV